MQEAFAMLKEFLICMTVQHVTYYIAFIHHEGRHTIRKVEIHKKSTMKHKNLQ